MTERGTGHGRGTIWLAAGVATGALATAVLALGARALFNSDLPASASPPPRFVEESGGAGVEHVYDGEFDFFVGGGVAVFDCDSDHRPDLYFAGGANPAALFRNVSPTGGALEFSRQPGNETDLTGVTGAYPLDVEGDGEIDLAVLRHGENVMLRGLGDCRFENAGGRWSIDGGGEWTTAFSATWEPGADLPTLAFGNYVELDEKSAQTGGCSDNYLFRPDDTGYGTPHALAPGWCTLSILFSDWDRSGRRDLRTTNDRHYYRDGEEQLWRIEPDEPPRLYTHDEGWRSMQIWGMGIASHDLTGDGLPEVFLTSQSDNKLQTLAQDASRPEYVDIAFDRGVTAHRPYAGDVVRPSTAWHPEFRDVNNDGLVDLYISKGNVEDQPEFASQDPSNLLLGNPDGTFTEVADAAGLVNFARARGAALVDLNLDGMLDLVEVNRKENIELWRNVGWSDGQEPAPMGNWVALGLEQPAPNVDAVGSWVEVRMGNRVVQREVTVGGGHAGGQLGWIHFGVGDAATVEVRVQWPDGEKGPWFNVTSNRFVTIDREAGLITRAG
ncbi:MAG TPA: CRTAC1 family protein [Acidimicrobiia bacterium]|nr:CRTAC1 family protein [Acidimicrobiia bacterium]